MKDKIIHKATELFFKLGFKSVTMDDIACEMCISKKTIYKFFANKEILIEEGNKVFHEKIQNGIYDIMAKSDNAIQENFLIRKMFVEMFKIADTSPLYQLKKHYPEIHQKVVNQEIQVCSECFRQNIIKGIEQGYYRKDIDVESYIKFYYTLLFSINENTVSEIETQKLEYKALEYHTRAMATQKGIIELETQLLNYIK
ncbi:TetR/AcrR family transcriptional regulator [Flavobacterium sp.]|uniref:TetR/AcrR family transcriptional regulator n=1 Tax=Flavobacterium sp. TaxID=239 RepID=UPI00286DCD29|nr:TetR/AcrR family transcriptional regulator [Flavobacterium sp.]